MIESVWSIGITIVVHIFAACSKTREHGNLLAQSGFMSYITCNTLKINTLSVGDIFWQCEMRGTLIEVGYGIVIISYNLNVLQRNNV